jgi:hypothetical protein
MRYELVSEIVFTDINGVNRTIKDMREYEDQITLSFININEAKHIDEIATRPEFYGEGSEFESYKIVDKNIVKLFDTGFDLNKIKKLEIPE